MTLTGERQIRLAMDAAQLEALRTLAADLGYTIGRGTHAGQGSVNQMMTAIADGDIAVVRAVRDATVTSAQDAAYARVVETIMDAAKTIVIEPLYIGEDVHYTVKCPAARYVGQFDDIKAADAAADALNVRHGYPVVHSKPAASEPPA